MASVQKKLEEGRAVWFEDGLRFACTQCGDCCTGPPGYVWYDEAEGRAMAEALGMSPAEFEANYTEVKHGRRSLAEVKREGLYDCVFLERQSDGRMTCSVYDARPMQCRTWPFWESNLKSQGAWRRAASHCPGMKAGGAGEEAKGAFVPVEAILERLKQNPKGL